MTLRRHFQGMTAFGNLGLIGSTASCRRRRSRPVFICLLLWVSTAPNGNTAPVPNDELAEITIQAPEPRYVAPTRRDQIGRIWAPVVINGKGPFRLVLDTGASRSGVIANVALTLNAPLDQSPHVLLRGVTGTTTVPTIRVDSFTVGDLMLAPATLAIVTDALGGAEGELGADGLSDKRIYIDFTHDIISITRSHGALEPGTFVTIPFARSDTGLLVIRALTAGIEVQAVVDTGAQATIGNWAMRNALVRRHAHGTPNQIIDVTTEVQSGESFLSPLIQLGSIELLGAHITYSDAHIFEHWNLADKPAMLIGMDVLGLLDTLIIDYRLHELQLRMRCKRPVWAHGAGTLT